jgi:hypothetical protein
MKLCMECEVDSKIFIPKEIVITRGEKIYSFLPNEAKILSKIKITVPISNPEKFYSKIIPTPEKEIKATFQIKADIELYKEVIEEFQELESLLAFFHNLRSIDYISPTYELILETNEEKENVGIFKFNRRKAYHDFPSELTEIDFIKVLNQKDRYDSLKVLMSFYREGKNEMHRFRYINAFFNFYFVIEGLFGKGKRGSNKFENELKDSGEFVSFVNWAINFTKKEKPNYYKKLVEMLNEYQKLISADEVIWLLVKIRGDLHHFVNNPRKLHQGHPFNHHTYEAVTYITHGLALKAILQKMVEIDKPLAEKYGLS